MVRTVNHFEQQSKLKQPRRVPSHASAQRNNVLTLLRQAKARGAGLRRDDAIFEHRITQVGARINELERMGYVIRHAVEPGARFVTYFLLSEPEQEKPLPKYESRKPDARQTTLADAPAWSERPRVATDKQGRPLEESEPLPLFGRRRE